MFDALAVSHKDALSGFLGTCADVDRQSKISRSGLFNPGGGYLLESDKNNMHRNAPQRRLAILCGQPPGLKSPDFQFGFPP